MKKILITFLSIVTLFSCETTPTKKEEKQESSATQLKAIEKDTIQKIDEQEEYNSKCSILSEMPKDSAISSLISKTTRVEAIMFKMIRNKNRAIDILEREAYTQIENNKIILDSIIKRVNLDKKQIQDIFNTLFRYKGKNTQGKACYSPRHVLVFYNQNKIIAFLEICFGCKDTRSYGVEFTDFCDEKWEKLREFF
ncbi:MAG: hypothetical protein MUC49_15975 [Raineya sp.]|jgi:hypothetical protein|nr:hypothetical protein [Raineya sp.]